LTIIGIAIGLAMDAFSVAITSGVKIKTPTFRHYFRVAFHFGLFQFLMPIIGFYSGVLFQNIIQRFDHWIAFGLLAFVGGKMIWESFQLDDEEGTCDPTRGRTLIILAIATSIDAAAIGFTLAALEISVFIPSIIIGIVCVIFSTVGMFIGCRIGSLIGKWAERAGGFILFGIGIRILIQHLTM
jgi:putative Mn2+ efflux pump MntP